MFKSMTGRIAAILLAVSLMTGTVYAGALNSAWPSAGHDLQNTRNQSSESKISAANASTLTKKWEFTTGGDVSATPAVDGSNVYFPDWAGNLYAVDQKTGTQIWSHKISEYTGIAGDNARSTPALVGNVLIFGDQGGKFGNQGAFVMAVNKKDGSLVWRTQVESVGFPIVTQSAVIDSSGKVPVAYVGVASFEEALEALIPGYICCSFRGSMLALNANTGQILWKTYTVPGGGVPGDSFTGGSVWGSTAVIDSQRNSLYIDTGNNYSVPISVQNCVLAANNDPAATQACIPAGDHFDSVMALDLKTGAIKWASVAIPFDSFNLSCIFPGNPGNCPQPAGPDYDFGQGPALFSAKSAASGKSVDLLGAGQKSGQYWAFNPDTGAVVWVTQVGPGGTLGGLEWGSAVDGKRIYVAVTNNELKPWTLINGQTVNYGGWSALDAATGQILWQTADPTGGIDPGAVSVANGVVYGCSLDAQGHMYGFDAASGSILWSFASGGSCNSGAAISNGTVYWGSGYSTFGLGTPNNKLFAFGLAGK
jgi:polyvinyl alcohol dehydrogenase (cytochrome)